MFEEERLLHDTGSFKDSPEVQLPLDQALAHKVEWTRGVHISSIETDDLVLIFRRCDESDLISFANEAIGYL